MVPTFLGQTQTRIEAGLVEMTEIEQIVRPAGPEARFSWGDSGSDGLALVSSWSRRQFAKNDMRLSARTYELRMYVRTSREQASFWSVRRRRIMGTQRSLLITATVIFQPNNGIGTGP